MPAIPGCYSDALAALAESASASPRSQSPSSTPVAHVAPLELEKGRAGIYDTHYLRYSRPFHAADRQPAVPERTRKRLPPYIEPKLKRRYAGAAG